MLKSILLFLFLFMLIILGVYIFSSPEENLELNARYGEYLSGALVKNTKTFNVEIPTDLFLPVETTTNQEFIENLNRKEIESNPDLLSYNREIEGENSSLNGNFGTPNITSNTNTQTSGLCDGGLIYDPCIVLGEPIRASGGMNFGSKKYN